MKFISEQEAGGLCQLPGFCSDFAGAYVYKVDNRGDKTAIAMIERAPTHAYTPEYIAGPEELPSHSIFVFGSNVRGVHASGSALTALERFGAKFGQAEGRQGRSYAIVTTDLWSDGLYPLELIEESVDRFLDYADTNRYERFYVTKVGTFRAGHSMEDVAGLWHDKDIPLNVCLPKEFT